MDRELEPMALEPEVEGFLAIDSEDPAVTQALEAEVAVVEPELELSRGERHRLEQREAEAVAGGAYVPRIVHPGNAEAPPLMRTASNTFYALREVRNAAGELVGHQRFRVQPKLSKKERRALREKRRRTHGGEVSS